MKRCCVLLALAALVGMPGTADARQQRVLVVSEARGFVHDSIPDAVSFFRTLGRRSRRFDVVPLEGAAALTSARLRRAYAVVFANTSGELPLPSRGALLRFVRRGGGLLGTHSASGRVFYNALGHFPATWRDRRQRLVTAGGLRWALGL